MYQPTRQLANRLGLSACTTRDASYSFGVIHQYSDGRELFVATIGIRRIDAQLTIRLWVETDNDEGGYWEQVFKGHVESEEEFLRLLPQVGFPEAS